VPSQRWTPQRGAALLVERFGQARAFVLLTELLSGSVPLRDCVRPPYADVLRLIGNDSTLLDDGTGSRLKYWPRSWAARALAYLGDDGAGPWLVGAVADAHWRVRMTAAQTLGRLRIEGYEEELGRVLDDPHERVRAAAATALGRTGGELAEAPLRVAMEDDAEAVRAQADRALARVEKRLREGR